MTIQEILNDLGIEYLESGQHHHIGSGWIGLKECPFCNSQNYHLGINLAGKFSVCWKCGSHHLVKVLEALGASRAQATEFFHDSDDVDFVPEKKRTGLKEPKDRGPLGPAHKKYLQDRGFDPDEIERIWKIEGIGIAHRLAWRIYIPILYRNTKVSWTTRSISPVATQRYLSASAGEEAINHRKLVYGFDFCRSTVIIVEGPTDAWAVGPGAGALFGIDFSDAQINALARIPYRFICFDSAPDAQTKAMELTNELACFSGQTKNILLDAKDAGSASKKELNRLRRTAKL